MGFFDNIGKTLSNAGQTIAQKSKDVVDTAKLNSAISDEQKIIAAAYEKIGRLYAERHADYPEPDFVEYLDEIKAAQNAIAECEQKLKDLRVFRCVRHAEQRLAPIQYSVQAVATECIQSSLRLRDLYVLTAVHLLQPEVSSVHHAEWL